MLIARQSKIKGTVKAIYVGQAMAEVIISVADDIEIISLITRDSARRMQLKVGDQATAKIQSTGVTVYTG